MMLYIAYPIDAVAGSGPISWLERVVEASQAAGDYFGVTYDPGEAFNVAKGAEVTRQIDSVNRVAVEVADAVLAFLPSGVPTVGVPLEIDRAAASGKPVAVLTDRESWSLAGTGARVFPVDANGAVAAALAWLAAEVQGRLQGGPRPVREPLPVQLAQGGRLPAQGYPDDAGFDLFVESAVTIGAGQAADIPCGCRVQLPPGTWGMLTGRSSTLRKRGLLVNQSVIDAGYRGPLFAYAWNLSSEMVRVEAGERVAQLLVLPNLSERFAPLQVDRLESSDRGEAGFGSTGQ